MKKLVRSRIDNGLHPNMEQSNVRTTGRIKKPKAVFDPSDNYLPRSQRSTVAPANSAAKKEEGAASESSSGKKQNNESPSTSIGRNSSTPPSDFVETCYVCLKKESKRSANAKLRLISCLECEKRVHKLCLKIDFEDFETVRQNYRCESCRFCDICTIFDVNANNVDKLVTCVKCVKSYHLTCHIPNVQKFESLYKKWKCNKCMSVTIENDKDKFKTICEIIGDDTNSAKITSQSNGNTVSENEPVIKTEKRKTEEIPENDLKEDVVPKKQKNEDNPLLCSSVDTSSTVDSTLYSIIDMDEHDIANVKSWSADQVTKYFAKYFPKEAYVFKEHEIDGTSLLLLKRSDIVKKMPIKIGPAVRIYSLILKIQTQSNNDTLGWNCGL